MTNEKKMTKKDYFRMLATFEEVKSNIGLMDFINHEIELLEKKNSAEKKPTATQIENEKLKKNILNAMEEETKYTVSDMLKAFDFCAGLSNQKVASLIRQLYKDELVTREEIKGKAFFSKV